MPIVLDKRKVVESQDDGNKSHACDDITVDFDKKEVSLLAAKKGKISNHR